ncbi:MAG: beta-ketoacyl synthase N-terminal-like domain-containing protein, partial [Actinomycetota bacterium]
MQTPAEYPPIVIRGAGVVSPCGSTLDDFWDGLVAAEHTAATLLQFEELEGFEALGCPASGFDPASRFERHELRRLDRSHQLAFWAAEDALEAADDGPEPERCAVVVGIGIGAIGYLENQFHTLMQRGLRSLSPLTIPVSMPNSIAGHLSMRHGYRGPAITV